MREVAWVIFDEIHYMRDKGTIAKADCYVDEFDKNNQMRFYTYICQSMLYQMIIFIVIFYDLLKSLSHWFKLVLL